MVTADHGEDFGEHGTYFCHAFLCDSAVRVPLLVRYFKKIKPGSLVNGPVELIDIFPTLLDLAGVSTEGLPLDGISLADSIEVDRGKIFAFTETRFYQLSFSKYKHYRLSVPGVKGKWTSVRYDHLKLIRIPTLAGSEWELYDLARDPVEKRNLYGDHPLQEFLQDALDRWMAKAAEPADIRDEETKQRLRSLGYID